MEGKDNMSIYPDNLGDFLFKYPEYIPYKFEEGTELKLYRRYYSSDNDIFKVLKIYQYFGVEYYDIVINNAMQAVLSYPVSNISYELVPDHKDIKNKNIINDNEWYTGAEIRYWFFVNRINIDRRYPEYKQYIYLNGKSEMKDTGLYKVVYNTKFRHGKIYTK